MALPHASPGEVIDIKPLGAAIAGFQSRALLKGVDLEVIRLVLPAGKGIPDHSVAGEITVQCLEGVVSFTSSTGERRLAAGELIQLAGGDVHRLRAIEDASVLVTIALA